MGYVKPNIKVTLGNVTKEAEVEVIVADCFCTDMVLGNDLLSPFKMCVSISRKIVSFEHESKGVRVVEPQYLAARKQVVFWGSADKAADMSTMLIQPFNNIPGLLVAGKKAYKKRKPIVNKESLKNYIEANSFAKLNEIKRDLDIAPPTISRSCKKVGLPARVSPKKFLINDINTSKRVDLASIWRRWGPEVWQKIVFTDESGIDNSGCQHRYVR